MIDDEENRLKGELSECVLDSSWWGCLAGVALAIPICVKKRTYFPLVYLGAGGSALDLVIGYNKCGAQRKALEDYQSARGDQQQLSCAEAGSEKSVQ